MILKGKYNEAIVYADIIEQEAINQIQELLNHEFVKGSNICIMPDTHAGAGCVIGTTMTIKDKICPNLVGQDIACGMYAVPIYGDIDYQVLDNYINEYIPSGFSVHNSPLINNDLIDKLYCASSLTHIERLRCSIGTLGGGNHFISVEEGEIEKYLIIHTGSRNLGAQVARYYQKLAIEQHGSEVSNPQLAYLTGIPFDEYMHDMEILNEWACLNREMIAQIIGQVISLDFLSGFHTIHNYVDTHDMILRKGAISAYEDELVLIPLNMKDGSLLCRGLENEKWNFSAPHGAGRILSRGDAKRTLDLERFQDDMKDIYTTSVCETTIDESPRAYKDINLIKKAIDGNTVKIIDVLQPRYNFKAH